MTSLAEALGGGVGAVRSCGGDSTALRVDVRLPSSFPELHSAEAQQAVSAFVGALASVIDRLGSEGERAATAIETLTEAAVRADQPTVLTTRAPQ